MASEKQIVALNESAQYEAALPTKDGPVDLQDDPNAPSALVSSKKQSLSDIFTIICAGFALISDGYQNSLMSESHAPFVQARH